MFDISKDSGSYLDPAIKKKKKSLVASKGKANKTNCAKLLQSCPTLCDAMDLACQALLSMGFSRQEYRSELPFLSPKQTELLLYSYGPYSIRKLLHFHYSQV